jgi:hypothetical protein
MSGRKRNASSLRAGVCRTKKEAKGEKKGKPLLTYFVSFDVYVFVGRY